jgi:hypothetical protein
MPCPVFLNVLVLTNSIEQSSSWETTSRSNIQEIHPHPNDSLPWSQDSATGAYFELFQSGPNPHIL